jgi:hypothetical protein
MKYPTAGQVPALDPPPPPALAPPPVAPPVQEERLPGVIRFKKGRYQFKGATYEPGVNYYIAESVVLNDNLTINTITNRSFQPNRIVSKVVIRPGKTDQMTIRGPFLKTDNGSFLYFTDTTDADLLRVGQGFLVDTHIYTIPKPGAMPGGRRRTKAKASGKTKAKRKTKAKATRRNRRS